MAFLFLLDSQTNRRWRAKELELVEIFVNRAAVALSNGYLHQQLERTAALEERQRIAADMHDGLAQTLSLLGLKADQADELIARGDRLPARQILKQMRDIVGQASDEVRLSIASLQADVQPRRSIQDLLGELVDQFRAGHNEVAWSLTSHVPAPLFLPASQREQLVPVVREALSNACRHARAGQIHVVLERYDNRMQVLVEDDGQGFRANLPHEGQEGHFGLSIMRARAARMGGYLQVDSVPGKGTRISLCWPLERDQHHIPSPTLEPAIPSTPPVLSGERG